MRWNSLSSSSDEKKSTRAHTRERERECETKAKLLIDTKRIQLIFSFLFKASTFHVHLMDFHWCCSRAVPPTRSPSTASAQSLSVLCIPLWVNHLITTHSLLEVPHRHQFWLHNLTLLFGYRFKLNFALGFFAALVFAKAMKPTRTVGFHCFITHIRSLALSLSLSLLVLSMCANFSRKSVELLF